MAGVTPGMKARDALERLERADAPPCAHAARDARRRATAERRRTACACSRIDSNALVHAGRRRPHHADRLARRRCSADEPETAVEVRRVRRASITTRISASTMPASRACPRSKRAASRAPASAPGARASATGNRPIATASSRAINARAAAMRRRNRNFRKGTGGAPRRRPHEGTEMNAPASNSARRLNGGQALAEMLKLSGVGPMFGMGGFQLLPFYEAMRALGLAPLPHQRRALRRLRGRRLCARHQPAGRVRRDARAGRDQPRHRAGRDRSTPACRMIAIIGDANREHAWKNMTQEARQVEILRPAVKELIRVEGRPSAFPNWCAAPSRSRPRAGRGRSCSTCRRTSATASIDFDAADFWVDDRHPEGAGAPHPPRPRRTRARRRADRQGRAAAAAGRRRHPYLGRLRRAARARRRLRHSGRAHDVRQGRDRLHASALGRPVRALFAHRQRSGRRVRLR